MQRFAYQFPLRKEGDSNGEAIAGRPLKINIFSSGNPCYARMPDSAWRMRRPKDGFFVNGGGDNLLL